MDEFIAEHITPDRREESEIPLYGGLSAGYPKTDGRQRPLGIAALEDKVVQHAVVQVLNQIGEEDFKGFSYGFRPERSQQGSPLVSGGTGCALRRDNGQEGELCAGPGHSVIFR
jgi:hypothetical protein